MTKQQKGILYIIIAALCFSISHLFVKLAGALPSGQKGLFSYAVSAVGTTVMMCRGHVSFRWQKDNSGLMLLRALLGVASVLCHYYAIGHMNLADATILNKLYPFFVILFCWMFLKEEMTAVHIACMAVAFCGSLLIVKPGFHTTEILPALMGLVGGITTGASYVAVRALGERGENSSRVVWFFSTAVVAAMLPGVLLDFTPMTAFQITVLLLSGVCTLIGHLVTTIGYSCAPAGELSIYSYTNVIFAGIWSYLVWGDLPDQVSLAGYVLIFAAALVIFQHGKARAGR